MASPSITTLPETSRTILRSTTILTSLPQIVFELVQNSLDADASQVEVGVDVEAWQCWVRDDGHGMDQAGMSILSKGGEEGRYGTSKAYNSASIANVSTFGFRGEALASAADLSCLEICSRTSSSRGTWSVILKGGKKLYFGSAVRWHREKPGTTVCIRDAFYNLPIRRRSHPSPGRTLELIRKDLESLALVFPHVGFSLENSAKEKNEGTGKGRVLTIPKTTSQLSAFRHLFGRALCENVKEVDVLMDDLRIQGFLSLEGTQSKAYQYLYVNRHPLASSDLHRAVDARFSASSFGKHALDEAGKSDLPWPTGRRSPRKNERRPVYVLNITVPSRSIDNCSEPAKSAVYFKDPDAVSKLLSTVVQDFLVEHGFCSARTKVSARTSSGSPSPRKKRKFAHEGATSDKQAVLPAPSQSDARCFPPAQELQEIVPSADPSTEGSQELEWVDPSDGQVYMIDSKTGNSYLAGAGGGTRNGVPGGPTGNGWGRRTLVGTSRLRKKSDLSPEGEACVPDWMQEALRGWRNPTFGLEEPGVPPMISLASSWRPWSRSQPELDCRSNGRVPSFDVNMAAGQTRNADDVTASFDREQLKRAHVIAQVDKKFVACLVENRRKGRAVTGSKVLVLVDQHAADERVRVEHLLSELCQGFLHHGPSTRVEICELKPAVPVLLTRLEAKSLANSEAYRHAFERWGFRFSPMNSIQSEEMGVSDDFLQVLVEAIPDVVSEKLLLADELRELIKGFLARFEVDGAVHSPPPASVEAHWTAALRWCPRELLDLVNSKACRGAIMFNDSLDIDQCSRLISQLSDTVWPFICAHGRPSLVPLTDIEGGKGIHRNVAWHRLECPRE